MLFLNKSKCTAETSGKVIKRKWNGNVWFLKVEYAVEGKTYIITEQLKYKKVQTYDVMNVPVGMKSRLSMGDVKEGDSVKVKYNPQKPKKAYMPDNEGMMLM